MSTTKTDQQFAKLIQVAQREKWEVRTDKLGKTRVYDKATGKMIAKA